MASANEKAHYDARMWESLELQRLRRCDLDRFQVRKRSEVESERRLFMPRYLPQPPFACRTNGTKGVNR